MVMEGMWASCIEAVCAVRHMMSSACRRYVPPPRYEDAVTTMEPAPFADLFGDSEDIFGQVRSFTHAAAALCYAVNR